MVSSIPSKKPLKRRFLGIIAIIVGIVMVAMYFLLRDGIQLARHNAEYEEGKRFMQSLPQMSRVDMSKETCFSIPTSSGSSNALLDCFVPNDFSEHTKWMENIEAYKTSLRSSPIITAKTVAPEKLSEFSKFFNVIHSGNGEYLPARKELMAAIAAKTANFQDFQKMIYLFSLEGEYDRASELRNIACKTFPDSCSKTPTVLHIEGSVTTPDGIGIAGASVRVLGTSVVGRTDRDGKYRITMNTFPSNKLRLDAMKPGFSNGVMGIDILSKNKEQTVQRDFVLEPALQFAQIDTVRKTISGVNTGRGNGVYTIDTTYSHYSIPDGSLVHADGTPFSGNLTAYFFEFTKSSNNTALLQNDIFDSVVGYAGNLMKTFGMPYVLFVSDSGERIHVLQSNPMTLQCTIAEMNALRTNHDKIYEPLTDADMKFLLEKSAEKPGEYPINRTFLIENQLLRFPAFWVFDQKKGTWVNQWSRVIDVAGKAEIPFYTISKPLIP